MRMRRALMTVAIGGAITLGTSGIALAGGGNPSGTGQPSQHCADDGSQAPGSSGSASGSAFNPDGTAGQNYAGEDGTGSQHSNSSNAVSQYDTACSKTSS